MDRAAWNRRYQGRGLVWSAAPNRLLVAEASSLPPGWALDLACGEGRNAVWLAERGWRATGVDFSEVALAKARALAAERCVEAEWVCADLLEYEPPQLAYDLVLVCYLQLPPGERRQVLGRAATAVAPGGTLVLVGHHLDNLHGGAGGPQDPSHLYTAADAAALEALEIERAEPVMRRVETDEGVREAIDLLVRAKRPMR